MQRWAFHLQIYFLNSRFKQVTNIANRRQTTIQDRTIYEDAYIFAANLYESKLLTERDYRTYLNLFQSMIAYAKPPDLLIYLKADIPKLVSQIQKRGRSYEDAIRLDYLKNLNRHYDHWTSTYKHGRLLVIDVNNLDFVANVEDFSCIVDRIEVELNGLFSPANG
jgi:deoxyadenosine/deoxycytidine kinase